MSFEVNQIIAYREMCNAENQEQLQRGMNFKIGGNYSVVLMSVKPNAPYADRISEDGLTIYYEGHDVPGDKLKQYDQPATHFGGSFTQNGMFTSAIDTARKSGDFPLVIEGASIDRLCSRPLKFHQYHHRRTKSQVYFPCAVLSLPAATAYTPALSLSGDTRRTRPL